MLRQRLHRRKRKRTYTGGAVSMDFDVPEVNATTSSQALQGTMHNQKNDAEQVVEIRKAMAGGASGITVPQMGPAGEEGNNSIAGSIGSTLKGRADGEFDKQVDMTPPKTLGGGRKSRRRRRKKKRKTKRRKGKSCCYKRRCKRICKTKKKCLKKCKCRKKSRKRRR